MKMMKRIIAVMMVIALIASLMAGCSQRKQPPADDGAGSNADSAASSAASSQADGEIKGTGDNNAAALSMTLFGIEYTLGKSKVKNLHDNDWGYDPETWKDVDMDEKLEYKKNGGSGKKMDNNTTEVSISYKNLTDTFATPENCEITKMEFDGSPDGTIGKASVKILGGKVDLAACDSPEKLESAFGEVLSGYTKEESDYTSFVSTTYQFDVKGGNVYIHTQTDKEKNTFSKIDTTLTFNESAMEEDDSSTGKKASSVSTGSSGDMWDDSIKLDGSGDNDSLIPGVSLFDKDYVVGKTTLKQMSGDGWGYDTESWKDVDMKKEIEYKTGYSNLRLHNNTAEIDVNIGNYVAARAIPEDCLVTDISINGSPDGVFTKAGIKLCDGKLDLSKYTTADELEDAMKSAASKIEKKKTSDKSFSYHFLANNGNGGVTLYVNLDKDNKIKNYDLDIKITDKFSYAAE